MTGPALRFVDEFRRPELIKSLAAEIERKIGPAGAIKLMEVCGGHTHSIYKYGIDDLLPPSMTSSTAPAARSA